MSRQLDDWLENYLQFTQDAESPTQYHVWSGITAIATALRRKCYTNWGLQGYVYPNLYVALVGPPGGRKGTAMKIVKAMLQQLEMPIGSDALGSIQALYEELQTSEDGYITQSGKEVRHKSLSIWAEEFQVFLNDRDPKLIASITDLFDNPDTWKYSTISRGATDLSNCWLTIFGAITPSLLQTRLSQDAVGGGLLSRIIFIVGYGPIKRVALQFLSPEEEKLKESLIQDLAQIALLSGPFKLTPNYLHAYTDWYEGPQDNTGIDEEKFLGYNSRRALHLKKICMVFSASESNDMIIRERHFQKALAILQEAEVHMPNAFYGFGHGSQTDVFTKLLKFIANQDKSFDFNEAVQYLMFDIESPEQLLTMLDMAQRSGKIKEETSSTSTRYEVIPQKETTHDGTFLSNTLYRRLT